MKRTGYLHDTRYLLHDTGAYHPEVPDRLIAIYNGIRDAGLLERLTLISAVHAELQWIQMVHDPAYIRRFEEFCLAGKRTLDYPDNQMCADTYETAVLAVGGILETVRRVMAGEIDNAFCAVRPPGHHAERDHAMGFCYFNNVAIAARYLQSAFGIERVAIIDFDVHHGNGTQHIFEKDPSVFYYSIHQHPSFAFPGTGREFETGTQKGQGFTKNTTVLPGQGDAVYQKLIRSDLLPAVERFRPQVLILSTGFDGHRDDDMSDITLSTQGYSWIMETMMQLGETYADGRIISVLEGGYCLKRLGELAANHVRILLNT